MSLDEVFELEPTVTNREAVRTVVEHGISPSEFFLEMGYSDEYNGRQVLEWLGY